MLKEVARLEFKPRESGTCPECGHHTHTENCSRPRDADRPEYYEEWNLFQAPVDPFCEESRKQYHKAKKEFFAKRDRARKENKNAKK